ncbi:hypothetical protein SAMN05444682_106200 [Parapedobacter indicus]|uniref:Uncharacterized protein n=1 Tax=Parapedobacter indicus TaxID=1477437 RepID=A0A1I3LZR1_9SPHI|nr:hypothetical protein CLV26_106135 [Parapedobacter indicus]SFI90291.1 hypothetical protein SAMN05444682_106200 [Parapedobacter indicus]
MLMVNAIFTERDRYAIQAIRLYAIKPIYELEK